MRRFIAIFLIAAPLGAQTRAAALRDFYRVEQAATARMSPDGKWVAFARQYYIEAENRRQSEIWLAPSDGSRPARRISTGTIAASDPRWSPDGALLSFTSNRRTGGGSGSESPIWFVRVQGEPSDEFQIPGVSESPTYSPDGKWIAFTKPVAIAPRVARLTDEERVIAERFTGKVAEWMNYRFDGRGYLRDPRDSTATPPRELFVVARDGGTPRRLTTLGVDVRDYAWRPDSKALALIANPTQRNEHSYERADIWIAPLDGTATRLTNDGYDRSDIAWTPDGETLLFVRQMSLDTVIARHLDHGAERDLFAMRATGGTQRDLTAEWDLIPSDPIVAPDGRSAFVSAEIGGESHLFRVPLGAGKVEQITHGRRRLSGISMNAALDRIAFVATDATHPGEAFASRLDGSDEHRVSALSDALLAEVRFAPAQRIDYTSADGTPVQGWVIVPSGAGPHPVILAMHGGPHGAYGEEFTFEFQLWASKGYAVVYTNPRGSTGYGEKFLWATWGGGWGDKDYQDVMAGVDYALAHFPLDGKRMGVTGYSYGGFLTDWVITQTNRFAAAVSGAGISNWMSDYGTADIPRTKESEFYGAPWEAKGRELLLRQSPIVYAGKVSTPTMFVHGEADLRVPIEQAEQMYTALQKRNVPARFVRYPGMYHGGWTAWNTVHRYWQELQWWDRWLAPKSGTPTQE